MHPLLDANGNIAFHAGWCWNMVRNGWDTLEKLAFTFPLLEIRM